MFLDNYNTNDLVAEQIKNYLSGTHCTYLQLKSFILNKRPIPEVHSNIVAFLSQAKSQDQSQIQKILENQAYKNQITEDEQQIINARIEQLKDEELRARFNRELSAIPTQISTYEAEQRSIEDKINWAIYKPNINIIASQYLGPIAQLPSRVLNQQNWIAQQLRDNSQYYQIKIQVLLEKKKIIQKKLIEIDQRADLRQQSNTEREDRAKERLSYEKTGEHIEGTLSSKNLRKLLKSVQKQHTSLQKKCDQLIEESKLIHFAFFIEQLPLHLPSMKLSPQEVDALLSVSKFVRLHLQHEYEAAQIKENLITKKRLISSQLSKLEGVREQLRVLKAQNPSLTSSNQQLASTNTEFSSTLEQNNNTRRRLSTSILLLVGLSLLFSIPFILTLSGHIPFFIAPVLVYLLVSMPPALLIVATIAVSIAALIYSFRAKSHNDTIKINKQTIEANHEQIANNEQQIIIIQSITLPSIEDQIKKDESTRDALALSLQKAGILSAQALKQAQDMQLVSQQSASFFKGTSPKIAVHSNANISESPQELIHSVSYN